MDAEQLWEIGEELAQVRADYAAVKDKAVRAAQDAAKAGMPETRIASILRVDRARTLRRWLGK